MKELTELGMTDFDWYGTRKEGILRGIDARIAELDPPLDANGNPVPPPDFARRVTIVHLLRRLRDFGEKHFDFFFNGFQDDTLQVVSKFPPARVLESILLQISFDLEVLWRAANQRQATDAKITDTLDKADKLAWLALEYAVNKKIIDPTPEDMNWTALTYLQKSPAIRVVPYANIALVGIPMTCLEEERDLLAIPHEVGHVVYWRRALKLADEPVNRGYMPQKPYKFRRWQEEVFADVYGALVAGPVMGLDFQDLALEHIMTQFLDEDDEHPTPALRPLLYAKVLKAKGQAAASDALSKRWKKFLKTRGTRPGKLKAREKKALTGAQGDDDALRGDRGFDKTIRSALALLNPQPAVVIAAAAEAMPDWTGDDFVNQLSGAAANPGRNAAGTVDDEASTGDTKAVYDSYKEKIAALVNDGREVPELEIAPKCEQVWQGLIRQAPAPFNVPKRRALAKQMEAGELADVLEPLNGTWVQLWLANGWTFEGPNSEPKQP